MKENIPSWQIEKNILDLKYRDKREWANNLVIISSMLIITFAIAYLQDSIPEKFLLISVLILIGILSLLISGIFEFYEQSQEKLKEIENLNKKHKKK